MFKYENWLLLILILVCALITMSLLDALMGGVQITTIIQRISENFETELDQDNFTNYQSQVDGWLRYENEGYAFEIQYPASFSPKQAPDQNSLNTALQLPAGTPVWEFSLSDPVLFSGTNLSEASLVIQVSQGEEAVNTCLNYKLGSVYQSAGESLPEVEINQTPFVKDIAIEGVMGGRYQRISYRTVFQSACYELTQIIFSTNLDFYPEGELVQFDEAEVVSRLDQVLYTFGFLNIEATFPEVEYPEVSISKSHPPIAKNTGDYADGIDVSHWQGDIGWNRVYDGGYRFAFTKATEGVGWTDTMLHKNIAEGTNAGVYMGVYHFARPDLGNSGHEEAEYFLSVAGDYLESGYLRPVLDLEVGDEMGRTALTNWVMEWLDTVKQESGVSPLIYTNLYYINNLFTDEVTEYDLWMAYWNCDSTVTHQIPPTGRWSDWTFWQYCVGDPGTVPGISTRIDLDIYNGNASALQDYDAASPLWVTLASDARTAPAPYFADMLADVNGDITGGINFYFWWDCESLDADVDSVETACGSLPDPEVGQCLSGEFGMVCRGVPNEKQLAEHTYQEVGEYTAKVIVERGDPLLVVEDRQQIIVSNPIRTISLDPEAPDVSRIDYPVILEGTVDINTSLQGAAQIEIVNENGVVLEKQCANVENDQHIIIPYSFPVVESVPGLISYEVWSRYRAQTDCPISDKNPDDKSLDHEVSWIYINATGLGLYNPGKSKYYLKDSLSTGPADTVLKYGSAEQGLVPIMGDWNGNGTDTLGIYFPVEGLFKLNYTFREGPADITFAFGPDVVDWLPIAGDWDGDGRDSIGLYNPATSNFYLKNENSPGPADLIINYGPAEGGFLPIVGDWDGDRVDTVGLFDTIASIFYLTNSHKSGQAELTFRYGPVNAGWLPTVGDWNNNGTTTVGLYNPLNSKWQLIDQNASGAADRVIVFGRGLVEWTPISGNW